MPKAKSRAQQRKLFALANRGEITEEQAKKHARRGKAFRRLPERIGRRLKSAR